MHMKEFRLSKDNSFPTVMTALRYTGKEIRDLAKADDWPPVPEWFKKNFREQIVVIGLWRHDLSKKQLDNPEVMGRDDIDLAAEHLAVLNPTNAFCKMLVEFAVKAVNQDIGKFREFLLKYWNKEMEILPGSMGDRFRAEGRIEGRADTLLDLLEAKFGSVPEQIKTLVMSASPDQLKAWTISVLKSATLESIFRANHRG